MEPRRAAAPTLKVNGFVVADNNWCGFCSHAHEHAWPFLAVVLVGRDREGPRPARARHPGERRLRDARRAAASRPLPQRHAHRDAGDRSCLGDRRTLRAPARAHPAPTRPWLRVARARARDRAARPDGRRHRARRRRARARARRDGAPKRRARRRAPSSSRAGSPPSTSTSLRTTSAASGSSSSARSSTSTRRTSRASFAPTTERRSAVGSGGSGSNGRRACSSRATSRSARSPSAPASRTRVTSAARSRRRPA